MNHESSFRLLTNGASVPWAEIPERPGAEFLRELGVELGRGGRLSSLFGVPEAEGVRLVAVLAFDAGNTLAVGRSQALVEGYPSLKIGRAHV